MYSEVQLTFVLLYLEPAFLILSDIFIALLCFKIVQLLNISAKYIDCQIYITNLKKTTKIDSNHRLDDKNILIICKPNKIYTDTEYMIITMQCHEEKEAVYNNSF